MRIVSYRRDDGTLRFGIVEGDTVLDAGDDMGSIAPGAAVGALAELHVLAPVPRPGKVVCVGRNYAEHAAETGSAVPDKPQLFAKWANAVVGPGVDVVHHAITEALDYEAELVVVIGGEGRIAGWAVANDVSARDLQDSEEQWTRAKGFDTSCPWGPWITTVDELADARGLRIQSWVNDEQRQDANTQDLIFGPQELVDFIAETCTLEPGDIILTGTPEGVGKAFDPPRYLSDGDVVRIEIERLGAIEHAVSAR